MTFTLSETMLEPKAVGNTRRGGIVTVSFLIGLGLGLLVMRGGEEQTAVEEPSLNMFQQITQATRAMPTVARPTAFQRSKQFMQPVAASVHDDAPVLGRREAIATGFAGLTLPAFAIQDPLRDPPKTVPVATDITPFPLKKGDPKASIKDLKRIISHSWGLGKVTASDDYSLRANLITIERVLTADLKWGEKLKVGEQKIEHMYRDFLEFKYNPETNVIDVGLDSSKSLPGKGKKIVEEYRSSYMTGKGLPAVGELFLREGTRESQQTTPTRIMRKGKVGENTNFMPKGLS